MFSLTEILAALYLFLLSGQVRVQKTGANGREITLYRVEAGDTCIITTVCLMSGADYSAEAIAESDIVARALPAGGFRELLATSENFRNFVFRSYGERISDLLMLIEEVTFGRIDQRLAAHLVKHRGKENALVATHQEIAAELGTAREVISRQLKEFERLGWVGLRRGQIALLDLAALTRMKEN